MRCPPTSFWRSRAGWTPRARFRAVTSEGTAARYDPVRLARQREQVLAVTEQLVAVHGFASVRLRDIAKSAGLSVGALQHHFETRDQLLKETFRWSCERRIARWREQPEAGGDPWERLVQLMAATFEVADFRSHSAIWAEYTAQAFRDEEVRAVMADVYEQWRVTMRAAVQAGVDAGRFRPWCSVETVVNVLSAQIDGLEIASVISPGGMELAALPGLLFECTRALLRVDGLDT